MLLHSTSNAEFRYWTVGFSKCLLKRTKKSLDLLTRYKAKTTCSLVSVASTYL